MTEILYSGKARAVCGGGHCYILADSGKPMIRDRPGWQRYADKEAAKMPPKGFWNGVVCYVPDENAYRINYGGMPEKL